MTSTQEAKLNMYNALLSFFESNNSQLNSVPALTTAVTALKANTTAIASTLQEQMKTTRGTTIDKGKRADNLVALTASVAGAVYAWASALQKDVLKEEMRVAPSRLRRLRDEELVPICKQFYDAANTHKADLEDYGISDASLTALKGAIDAYSSTVPAPRNAIVQKKAYRNNLQALFKTTDALLKERIDKLMLKVGLEQPLLGNVYRGNRMIVNNSTTVTQLKATIVAGDDGTSIPAATLTLQEVGITVTGNSKGQLLMKPAPGGVYTIVVHANGFKPYTVLEYKVVTGQVNNLQVELKRI